MADEDPTGAVEVYRRAVHPARLELLEAAGGPLVFERAEGAWVTAGGRRYLDLVCGYGTATLGHHPSRVTAALGDALGSAEPFTHPAGISPAAGRLADKLCALAGAGLSKVYFGNSGTEGIEAALKLAMARTGRDAFVCFAEAFHGFSLGSLSLCGAEAWRSPFPALGVTALRTPFGDVGAVESWLAARPVAGVVVEAVQGMAGARAWPAERLREVAELCRRHGTLLIVDEVLTGAGRTGTWFAFQHARVEPDVVVASKGLTGGAVPLCAVLMTDEVYWAAFGGRPGIHSSTFEANLLAMTAGLAVIETVEDEDLLRRVVEVSRDFERRLGELRDRGAGITDVRVSGLLIGVRVSDEVREGELWGAPALQKRLLDREVLVKVAPQAPSWLQLTPPFTLSDAEADFFFERLG
jgi:ornithine--oxo-acid transaminase